MSNATAMEIDLTIAICAHNAAGRIGATLAAFSGQNASQVKWEILLIDNNSSDATSRVAREVGESLNLPLRVIFEAAPGLTNARRRAANEARGRLLSYIDDDNIVALDWIVRCVEFLDSFPQCGIVGGRVDPIFEDPASRPADFDQRYAEALAVRNLGDQPLRLIPPKHDGPPGAGMTGRTALFRTILNDVACRLSGPKGRRLSRGEDSEIGLVAHRLGWELWYAPTLRMGHVLPPARLNEVYLNRLIAEGSESGPWLDYLRGVAPKESRWQYFKLSVFWLFGSFKNAMLAKLRGPGHPLHAKMRFWAKMFRYRAIAYWDLATASPFDAFEASVKEVKTRAGLPEAVEPERR
ncbi:MAG: glycosyltransferase family 2 protein [Planctomycetota bacterium]|nr:glycosyltransferase family 2 protein [Planctomycetota bacterium]